MDSILDRLYISELRSKENISSTGKDKEEQLYDKLENTLTKEQKELFDEFLEELEKLENKGLNQFQMNSWLKDSYFDLVKLIDENEKLYKSEALVSILEELGDNEDMIVGSINYYNDSVVNFNKLVMSFPAKIVAFLFRYKKKEFHNNEKKEMYQILNEK